jgi:hypothetical protein
VENRGRMMSTRENARFVHQNTLMVLPAESFSSKAGLPGEGNNYFFLTKYLCSYLEGVFNMP